MNVQSLIDALNHKKYGENRLKFLFLEPFFGGSHRNFAEGLRSHSRHKIDLFTLPARFWKWRMRGAALYFFKKIPSLEGYDGLIVSDLMSLSDFKSLWGPSCPPALVYFHENQITYPLAPGESIDFQFGFTDITTALAADQILFNSRFHLDAFFSNLPDFINMMPEYRPNWVVNEIRSKSEFIYPGCRFPAEMESSAPLDSAPPLIIWNHRWEFDKNPADFFNALDAVIERGADFQIALLGENFQVVPENFIAARERYGNRVVRYGYVESIEKYREWLMRGSIVISTAKQENFGISVIEAIRYGCIPLLPDRLAYPEILPKAFHSDFLYKNQEDLIEKLFFIITNYPQYQAQRNRLSEAMGSFAWENLIDDYDEALENLVRQAGN
jgi:glycosyltransferase involved in cell wall biosynthesis